MRIGVTPRGTAGTAAYEVTIENVEPLTVGGGAFEQSTSPFDIPVAKVLIDGRLVPYIPGSTLKGMLRATAEEILMQLPKMSNDLYSASKGLYKNSDEIRGKVLLPLLRQFIEEEFVRDRLSQVFEGQEDGDHVVKIIRDILMSVRPSKYVCISTVEGLACELPVPSYKLELMNEMPIYPCPVCQTYGAPGLQSYIAVTDAYPTSEPLLFSRRHIAIDRLTGASAQGKLYDQEYVAPGAKFTFFLISSGVNQNHVDNMKGKEVGEIAEEVKRLADEAAEDSGKLVELRSAVLALSLKALEKGRELGRRKSAGYGLVKLSKRGAGYGPTQKIIDELRAYLGASPWTQ